MSEKLKRIELRFNTNDDLDKKIFDFVIKRTEKKSNGISDFANQNKYIKHCILMFEKAKKNDDVIKQYEEIAKEQSEKIISEIRNMLITNNGNQLDNKEDINNLFD